MTNTITIQCYGILEKLTGAFEHSATLADSATVESQLAAFCEQQPSAIEHINISACAVGTDVVSRKHKLNIGDTLVLLPPVGGG